MTELKKRILVVDDDQRLRELVVRYLGEQGFEARAVPDGGGMDRQLARERYDLVVLDLMLPGEDGLAICRRLRAANAGPGDGPAIIMLTAKGDEVDRIVGLEMGADDTFRSPSIRASWWPASTRYCGGASPRGRRARPPPTPKSTSSACSSSTSPRAASRARADRSR